MESIPSDNNNSFRKLLSQSNMEFDYEVNSVKFVDTKGETDSQIYFVDKSINGKSFANLNFDSFWDSLDVSHDNKGDIKGANFLKKLVSKKKRRFQDENFDLDLSYITRRLIAMGFPSTGCESIWRNSSNDINNFFRKHHPDFKVYNVCLEKKRIYSKERFPEAKVGLFPFLDHNPCPIKLILDFCVDICLYFIKNPYAVASVHCKAGKGRTGVMCINYLIFTGLCKNSDEAIHHYAAMRTHDRKGVTIASQIRYVKYFETFLSSNFNKPYYKMIPKIMKYYINPSTQNMIKNYLNDDSYFMSKNKFVLKKLKIGPFEKIKNLKVKFSSLIHKCITFPNAEFKIETENINNKINTPANDKDKKIKEKYYYVINFNSDYKINFDISMDISSEVSFYLWINLWYSTLENVAQFIFLTKLFLKEDKTKEYLLNSSKLKSINLGSTTKDTFMYNTNPIKAPTFVEMKNRFFNFKNSDEVENDRFDSKEFCIKKTKIRKHHNTLGSKLGEKADKDKEHPLIQMETSRETEISSPVSRKKIFDDSSDHIIELVERLSIDPDLNSMIKGINDIARSRNILPFNKNEISIFLNAKELDKFANAKKMVKDFGVYLDFKLTED